MKILNYISEANIKQKELIYRVKNKTIISLRTLYEKLIESKLHNNKFFFSEFEYVIISLNPIFSIIIAKYLEEKKCKNVLISTLYLEDSFQYNKIRNSELIKKLNTNNLKEFESLDSFFTSNIVDDYYYTTNKKLALIQDNEVSDDNNTLFISKEHYASKAEVNFSKDYKDIWDLFLKVKKNNVLNQVSSDSKLEKNSDNYFIFGKKIILLSEENPYIRNDIKNKNIFRFSKNITMEDFNNFLNKDIE